MDSATNDSSANNAIIQISNVGKSYGNVAVLKDISLTIAAGEHTVICGPSGSGKSTLIRCINGLTSFDTGSISVAGISLGGGRSEQAVHRRVGMVFQQFNLFPHLSVMQNLTLAPIHVLKMSGTAARDKAMYYLDKVKMIRHAEKYPTQLSGGEQQRIAIARALCMEPRIMLFDEPTSALDPEMINEVLETMISLANSGMTMLCVTHEMGFARSVADRVVFMADGEIIEVNQPQAFFDRPQSPRLQSFLRQIINH
jgi:ABC-type polar amino acid transport system ATPase subunit